MCNQMCEYVLIMNPSRQVPTCLRLINSIQFFFLHVVTIIVQKASTCNITWNAKSHTDVGMQLKVLDIYAGIL